MKRSILFILSLIVLSGCATLHNRGNSLLSKDSEAKGYRAGVKENINKFAENFIGNDFPYYYWQAPLIQRVYKPARIRGGSYIPAHYEYVIIDPAEWRETYGYPISTQYEEVEDEIKYDKELNNFTGSSLGE